MKIIKLNKSNENVVITFEDGKTLLLDFNTVVAKGFRKDDEIDDAEYEKLKLSSNRLTIKNSAFIYLSKRIHSRGELFQKLRKKEYEHFLINEVLDELEEKKYLDDEEFALKFSEEKLFRKKWGIEKVKSHLYQKGIKQEIIGRVVSEFSSNQKIVDNAIYLAEKKRKFYSNKELSKHQLNQKLFAFLQSRGFSFDVIKKAISFEEES